MHKTLVVGEVEARARAGCGGRSGVIKMPVAESWSAAHCDDQLANVAGFCGERGSCGVSRQWTKQQCH